MMTATETRTYRLGEFHRFEGGGRQFLYLVPAGAIFEMDDRGSRSDRRAVLGRRGHALKSWWRSSRDRGFTADEAAELDRGDVSRRASSSPAIAARSRCERLRPISRCKPW